MFLWLLLGGGLAYLIAKSSSDEPVHHPPGLPDTHPPATPPPAGTPLVASESGATSTPSPDKSLSFGGAGEDSDPWAAALAAYDAMYATGSGGFGVPISGMSDVLGGGTRQATTSEVQTPRDLPASAFIEKNDITEAPIESATRVTFVVRSTDVISFGTLEGTYAGPADPSTGAAYVYVDRIAIRPSEAAAILPFGRYTVPASSMTGYSDSLDRVRWTAVDPQTVGLSVFSSPPAIDIGDKIPLVVRDAYGNIVIAVTTLRALKGDIMTVLLDHPWKQQAFKDEGFGSPVFPRLLSQALLEAPRSMILDMAKLA